jgi:hypothetical protein
MVLEVLALAIEGIGEVLVEAVVALHGWEQVLYKDKRKVVTVYRGKVLVVGGQAITTQLHNLQVVAVAREGQQAREETVISLLAVEVGTVYQAQYRVLFKYTVEVAVEVWGLQETLTTTKRQAVLKAATEVVVIRVKIQQLLTMALRGLLTQAEAVVERLGRLLLGRVEQGDQEL